MKKKYVAAMLSLMAALSFSACGQEKITEEPAAVETPEVTEGEASFAQDPAVEKAETSEVEDAMDENMIADYSANGKCSCWRCSASPSAGTCPWIPLPSRAGSRASWGSSWR